MIVLGRVTAPFGIRGWVKIHPFGDDPEMWSEMPQLWLGADDQWRPFDLKDLARHGKGLIAAFRGVEDRNTAGKLTGLLVGAPREVLPATDDNEYYWADLIGLEVVNCQGDSLGRVTGLMSSGAHEILCVRDGEDKKRLLPFVAAVVKNVDRAAGIIRVDWEADW
ncbi:MAG: ribosome maturation factor RimM [Pseudomonadota bacterium]